MQMSELNKPFCRKHMGVVSRRVCSKVCQRVPVRGRGGTRHHGVPAVRPLPCVVLHIIWVDPRGVTGKHGDVGLPVGVMAVAN